MRRLGVLVLLVGCGKVTSAMVDARDQPHDGPLVDSPAMMIDARVDAMIDAPSSSGIPAGAVMWLKMDDTPTDGALDSAGAHTATCTSCPALVAGKKGMAYQFTGTNRIDVAAAANLLPGTAFTMAAWIRLDVATAPSVAVGTCKPEAGLDCSYGLMLQAGVGDWYTPAGGHLTGGNAFAQGVWHHSAMTWDGTTKRGYLDGVQVAMVGVASIASDATTALNIGDRAASTLPLMGSLDELVFYNRALSPAEIAQLATP